MRKSAREKLMELKRKRQEPAAMTLEDMLLLLLDGERPKEERSVLPTQRAFIYDPARIKAYMGPAGSAKTSALCAAGWLRALLQPGSKGLVARANYNDLMDTTGLRMTEMLNRLPKGILLDRDKSPPMKWYVQSVPTLSPEGDMLDDTPAMITFMGLQDGLGSYEFNWAILDEADEISRERAHEVNTRLRHKGGDYSEMLAFNPPDMMHWLYTACTGQDYTGRKVAEPWMKLFVSQPKENLRNLPPGYYERLADTLPEDMRMRLVEGQWGSTFQGQPVYREFKYGLHVIPNLRKDNYDKHATLFRFWDFGYRRPCCIWAQQDFQGRLLMYLEFLGENLEIGPFVERVKSMGELHFPGHKDFIDYGDPAARQKKDTGSTLTELGKHGVTLRYKISTIEEGLRIGRTWLEKLIDGKPAFTFDQQGVPVLINALRGGYALDDAGQKPVKDGYYDHEADAWRYGVINLYGGGMDLKQMQSMPTSIEYDRRFDRYGSNHVAPSVDGNGWGGWGGSRG